MWQLARYFSPATRMPLRKLKTSIRPADVGPGSRPRDSWSKLTRLGNVTAWRLMAASHGQFTHRTSRVQNDQTALVPELRDERRSPHYYHTQWRPRRRQHWMHTLLHAAISIYCLQSYCEHRSTRDNALIAECLRRRISVVTAAEDRGYVIGRVPMFVCLSVCLRKGLRKKHLTL